MKAADQGIPLFVGFDLPVNKPRVREEINEECASMGLEKLHMTGWVGNHDLEIIPKLIDLPVGEIRIYGCLDCFLPLMPGIISYDISDDNYRRKVAKRLHKLGFLWKLQSLWEGLVCKGLPLADVEIIPSEFIASIRPTLKTPSQVDGHWLHQTQLYPWDNRGCRLNQVALEQTVIKEYSRAKLDMVVRGFDIEDKGLIIVNGVGPRIGLTDYNYVVIDSSHVHSPERAYFVSLHELAHWVIRLFHQKRVEKPLPL